MGIAVSYGKMGFAYLVDGELMDWKLSIDASRNPEAASRQAEKWIGYYELDAVVIEDPEITGKGKHTQSLQRAVADAARRLQIEVVLAPRSRENANKYAEAAALAEEFPQLAPWLPDKRRLWEQEPRYIILFEALSLVWNWWRSSPSPNDDLDTIDW